MKLAQSIFPNFRPNFFAMCSPNWNDIDCGTKDTPNFVTNYQCEGNDEIITTLSKDKWQNKEVLAAVFKRHPHTSFFSGHSSVAWSSAVFICLYLKGKFKGQNQNSFICRIVKVFQIVCIGFAIWVSYTRITDFWHHPTDVLTGAIVGIVCQYMNVRHLMQL